MTLSPTWNVTFPPLQEVVVGPDSLPGTALTSIAHMTHPHQREMAEKLRFLAFQAAGLPVQPGHCRFVDTCSLRITSTISRIWLERVIRRVRRNGSGRPARARRAVPLRPGSREPDDLFDQLRIGAAGLSSRHGEF